MWIAEEVRGKNVVLKVWVKGSQFDKFSLFPPKPVFLTLLSRKTPMMVLWKGTRKGQLTNR